MIGKIQNLNDFGAFDNGILNQTWKKIEKNNTAIKLPNSSMTENWFLYFQTHHWCLVINIMCSPTLFRAADLHRTIHASKN